MLCSDVIFYFISLGGGNPPIVIKSLLYVYLAPCCQPASETAGWFMEVRSASRSVWPGCVSPGKGRGAQVDGAVVLATEQRN